MKRKKLLPGCGELCKVSLSPAMTLTTKPKNDMHGKIWFSSMEDMTEFLIGIVGKTTATWEAMEINGLWVVEFSGGH